MSIENNKAMERVMVDEALNRGNMGVVSGCLGDNFVYHGPGGAEVKGIEGYKKFLVELRKWYPDMRVTIDEIIAEGDIVATRNTSTFSFGGKQIKLAGSIVDRFEYGKITETWEHYDRLDLYRQMGITPPSAAPQALPV
jgi:predicted ester cyclase